MTGSPTPRLPKLSLPVDGLIPEILSALKTGSSLVLKAAPGTGKTTRVPPALLSTDFLDPQGEILVLEPRRLAAKLSAERVASEIGSRIGEEVGYHFRFENRTTPATRLRYLTEGMLMRRLISDPELRGGRKASVVLLDEFHERHLHGDVALATLKHLQRTSRPDLKIVVMSATLDQDAVATYLGAPILAIDQKLHEVKVEYLPSAMARHLEIEVAAAVTRLLPETPGDILIFLPGMAEIRRCENALGRLAESGRIWIAPLHGELSKEEQARAVAPALSGSGPRRVILSTNLAETSLTIPGVTGVIDSGLHRQASHSWWSGVPHLRTRPISRASAIQRAGRAGRTAPGHCLRLYTKGDYEGRAPYETAEIRRADLTPTMLEVLKLGIHDPGGFDWFEKPAPTSIQAALSLLRWLGAATVSEKGWSLTAIGLEMAELSAHPRLARALIEGARLGCLNQVADLCAWIAEGSRESGGSLLATDALGGLGGLGAPLPEGARKAKSQWLAHLDVPASRSKTSPGSASPGAFALERALLAGFPDRVAMRKQSPKSNDTHSEKVELLFASGGSATLPNQATLSGHDYFVVLDARERQGAHQVRATTQIESLLPIPGDLLLNNETGLLVDTDGPVWNEARKKIRMVSRLAYGELTLSESDRDFEPEGRDASHSAAAGALLARAVIGWDPSRVRSASSHDLLVALPVGAERREGLETLFARLSLLRDVAPQFSEIPDFCQDGALGPLVLAVLSRHPTARALEEASDSDWLEVLGLIPLYELDAWTPTQIQLGPARKSRIKYNLIQPPWVESRLQDFFGVKKNPSVLKGRLPLVLHLLAPNQRALQVTKDLEGFWKRVYPELRNQLSRRYPRHAWPEDPEKIPPREGL